MINSIDKNINSKLNINKNFHFDYYKNQFFYNNQEVILTRTECKILKILLDNQNNFISIEELEKIIRNTTKNSIKTLIAKMRTKTHKNLIKTVYKKGYKIIINNT